MSNPHFDSATTASGPGSEPEPLTRERIIKSLTARDYHFQVDDDGDIGGNWEGRAFYFFQYGRNNEILQVRACWNVVLDASMCELIQLFCNDWNTDHIWPKVYVREEEDESLGVYAEISTDLERGVSDAQLDHFIACALGTATQFLDAMDVEFGGR